MGLRRTLRVVLLSLLALLVVVPPAAADPPTSSTPPSISGVAQYGEKLTAYPGRWTPSDVTFSYQWSRGGTTIAGATDKTYSPAVKDIGRTVTVTVVATTEGGEKGSATSAPSPEIARGVLDAVGGQKVTGTARYTKTLTAHAGHYSTKPVDVGYQWLRGGKPIAGATKRTYALHAEDVGRKVRVLMTITAKGYDPLVVRTTARHVKHRIAVRRVVRYHVETRGTIKTSLAAFKKLAQETYDDPRGWRDAGIEFRQVARGGSFTLVLSQASLVPSFSSACSSEYSCRVGRYVIINQDRWRFATPPWRAAHGSLRDYRHMVVNHETGHWLGLGHAHCPGRGQLAPVMQQQSKDLEGCRFNPFPTNHEIASRTPHGRPAGRGAPVAPYAIAE